MNRQIYQFLNQAGGRSTGLILGLGAFAGIVNYSLYNGKNFTR